MTNKKSSQNNLNEKDAENETPKKEQPTIPWLKLYTYATPLDWFALFVGSICAAASGAALPLLSVIMGQVVDSLAAFSMGKLDGKILLDQISQCSLYFIYLAIGVFVTTYVFMALFKAVGEKLTFIMRHEYLVGVLKQEMAWSDVYGAGQVATAITTNTDLVQEGISDKVALIVHDLATFVSGFIIAFVRNWKLTLVTMTIVPLIVIIVAMLNRFMVRFSTASLDEYANAGTLAEESISSIRTLVAFNQKNKILNRYQDILQRAKKWGLKKALTLGISLACIFGVIYLGYALAFWFGGRLISWGEATSGTIVNVFFAILIGTFCLANVAPNFQAILLARGAGAKLFEAIDRVPVIDSSSDAGLKPSSVTGEIEFRNINFRYPTRMDVPIFDDYSLKVDAGTTTALVGMSGSGKSTTIQLLERFYDPIKGQIFLDGTDTKELNLKWLRRQLGLVSQEPVLFSGTIFTNVAAGLIGTPLEFADIEKQKEAIIEACKMANAHDFITALPKQYDTDVGERGFLLSGGQKQRVAIARAIVKDPKILLLDEATSALDSKSEHVVQDALDRAAKGRTTIVIAHRLATIKNADKIVVMDRGQIIEMGNHHELMQLEGGVYRKLVDIQNVKQAQIGQVSEKAPHQEEHEHIDPEDLEMRDAVIEGDNGEISIVKIPTKRSLTDVAKIIRTKSIHETPSAPAPKQSVSYLARRVFSINKTEWKELILGVIGACGQGCIFPSFAIIFSGILNAFNQTGAKLDSDVSYWACMFIVIAVAMFIGNFAQSTGFGVSAEKLTARLRYMSFESMLKQEIGWFDKDENSTGVLTSRLSKEAQDIQGLSGITLGTILQTTVNLGLSCIIGLVYGWKLALVVIVCLPILLIAGYINVKIIHSNNAQNQSAYAKSAEMACEATNALRTVAALTKEDQVATNYSALLLPPLHAGYRNAFISTIAFAAAQSINFLVNALAFWYGGKLVSDGEYTMQQMFTIFMAVIVGASNASRVFAFSPDMSKAKESAEKLFANLDRKPLIDSEESAPGKRIDHIEGNIEFENVHFNYPTRPHAKVLQGLNLEIKPGQYVALVGPSGCGKSTTIGLVERFYDILSGSVKIDGIDVREYNLPSLRDHIALVGQEPNLYDMTIRENILFGSKSFDNPPTQAQVEQAAKDANIHDFIMSLPQGYDTGLGGKGASLSGGQKQRIAIARALVRNPKILLLDEASSALDAESEAVVQAALDSAAKGRTTISIAHRLSTIQKADRIYVFQDGVILEEGTHDELMNASGLYAEMASQQVLDKKK
ncbi:P-loop containing nucleoside triphosphate hydrolase protein [Conidiobolus coronatus NRRL 28638]|uniref:p-loop containing nucleoside triphosphate hydrolase protein n=1 Tax=Conidiobolus coronatus (strain ATCC 28846 / CBS 209.66 / NRRL 28638) TaxID=796925 RepID=A0A137PBP2_CONC2|nr:P-loop containing nucleoside triphosphate hydrolase protein [Conidiobolus coronatus NRRL 28638]|eukprot:KXN72413.1 P-loop containing nucleoside triphosphate hydrolase protein [Conidiobolus coronatus NRRL 28638]